MEFNIINTFIFFPILYSIVSAFSSIKIIIMHILVIFFFIFINIHYNVFTIIRLRMSNNNKNI